MTTLRPPREEDATRIALLASTHAPEPMPADEIRQEWASPTVDPELDARVDAESYALVESLEDGRVWITLWGAPTAALLDWAESRAQELGERAVTGAWSANRELLAALEERGYELSRHSYRMEIDLAHPLATPAWPDGIVVRTFRSGDEQTFYAIHRETFADTIEGFRASFAEWAHWLLQPPFLTPDLWFLATAGDGPVGFAICHPHPAVEGLGFVRSLGVRRPCRGRGLGRALLLHAFAEFRNLGLTRAALGVDANSKTGADRLYGSVGMRIAARFDQYRKELA